jgi:tripartite-type tricarboxylate transporter receptor subunit TctC
VQRTPRILALLLALLSPAAMAQDGAWPTQTVRLIAPSGPGGNPDVLARLLADKFTGRFGQPFIVENVPGAGGIVAAKLVAKARPGLELLASPSRSYRNLNAASVFSPTEGLGPSDVP